MSVVSGVHHVALIVSDYAASKHFYTKVMGFAVLAENYREERNSWKLDVALPDGKQLEIFSFSNSPERPSYPEARGLRHLAFVTENIDDSVRAVKGHGVSVEAIRVDPYTGARFTFFNDPDGLPLELYEVLPL